MVGALIGLSHHLGVLAASGPEFTAPRLDYHALAPEIVLTLVAVVVLLADLFLDESRKFLVNTIAGIGIAATAIPLISLGLAGDTRRLFGGAYVVDDFSLVLKGVFLIAGYLTLLMGSNYLQEGDYHEGEFAFLVVCSLIGMVVMSSSRDLITIFVALETLSLPAYLLAGWQKRNAKSNEASVKYYLLGVVASAVMLYGMSLVYGVTGQTVLERISVELQSNDEGKTLAALGILLIIIGFAFKVSAVPFHQWAPDTYEGAPTPVTAFLSVASKAAGFVALMELVFVGFFPQSNVWTPIFWVLAVLTMTVGNLIALRQTNIVRMLAYSSVAQAGFILVPFAVAGERASATLSAQQSVVTYLVIYTLMNLGAFTMIIAVARKTHSGEITSYNGLFHYSPGLAVLMTVFMFSLAGIPPMGGWYAKFTVFNTALDAGGPWSVGLAAIAAVNAVIGATYYLKIMRAMWMKEAPDGSTKIVVPSSLRLALALCGIAVMVVGVLPSIISHFAEIAQLAS
jgi:NADH-quinone oxidoreductase subunit N